MPWQKSLNAILQVHGKVAAGGGKAVGFETQAARRDILEAGLRELWKLGYHLPAVQSFRGGHMKALGYAWEAQGMSPSTIQNRISVFRTLAEWIGKPGMIWASHHYVKNPKSVHREIVTNIDKTWSGQNQSLEQKLPAIQAKDSFVAIQLKLQRAFGLRMKEASLLRPHLADKTHYLAVNWGTKGGRHRIAPIENSKQRDVLLRAKQMVHKNDSMVPKRYNFKQWRNHYYYICPQQGISREQGITSHGLRHERFNEMFYEKTGCESPVKGGHHLAGNLEEKAEDRSPLPGRASGEMNSKVPDRDLDKAVRQEIAEVAGHSRADIASVYIGSSKSSK